MAVPQVGILKRIIIVDLGEGAKKPIDPELIEAESE
ncbi:peptide deformylase [Acetivibrio cellulolyticus]|nr:hypothetical protein [Acetivibrio cellulolyticus]